MREIYTLTHDQVDIGRKTIHLRRTKSGSGRNVPLNAKAREILSRDWPALRAVCGDKHVLPFWQGDLDPKHLTDLTSQLSRDFARAVAAAGVDDIHFHDTRHEALCRWVLNARQPLSSEELGRAAGMKDQRTRMRYLSLRGGEPGGTKMVRRGRLSTRVGRSLLGRTRSSPVRPARPRPRRRGSGLRSANCDPSPPRIRSLTLGFAGL